MGNEHQHIISTLKAELTMPSALSRDEGRSEQLKEAVRKALDNIVPKLDRAFGNKICYRIKFLSVELELREKDMSRLETLLEEALIDKIMNAGSEVDTQSKMPEGIQGFKKIKPEQRRQDLLWHFLQKGRFPWWAGQASLTELEEKLREISASEWQEAIKPLARSHPEVLRRLAAQFPEDLIQQLIKKSSDKKASSVQEIVELVKEIGLFLEKQHFAFGKRRRIVMQLHEHALWGVLFEEEHEGVLRTMTDVVLRSFRDVRTDIEVWERRLQKPDNSKDVWLELVDEKTQLNKGKDIDIGSDKNKVGQGTHKDSDLAEENDLAVSNGGLVLLHPFIESLFENVGLLEEGEFSRPSARERAVCLLHYIATGSKEFREHEVVLPKFLCVWPPGEPVNRFLPISEYETEECKAILDSAISHWEALKNTSIEEFRNNFLQRKGILREEGFGWSLYIERKTQDILLEKLPWNLSVVKHKWMDEMLTVHWQ